MSCWVVKHKCSCIHSMLGPHIKWLWNHNTNHLSLLQVGMYALSGC